MNDETNSSVAEVAKVLTPEEYRDYIEHIVLFALAVPGLYILMVFLGRYLKRKHGVQLGWLYHLFAFGTVFYACGILLGLGTEWPFLYDVASVTVVLGSLFLIALIDRYVWDLYFKQRHHVEVPKFLVEVMRLAILLMAIFLVLRFHYHHTINELLIAPGILVVIVGFATQDSVGNIISGLTLQLGKPYKHGDWLQVDNKEYAEVIEVNWRVTRLRTLDDILIEIPHRQMAAQNIVNLNRPLRKHAMRISVGIEYSAPPTRVKDVLLHATANARGISPDPKPQVHLKNFGDFAIEYEIRYWIDDHSKHYEISDSVRTNVWYSLRRHGIRIPFPTQSIHVERPAATSSRKFRALRASCSASSRCSKRSTMCNWTHFCRAGRPFISGAARN